VRNGTGTVYSTGLCMYVSMYVWNAARGVLYLCGVWCVCVSGLDPFSTALPT
jgi:hypothetical protein